MSWTNKPSYCRICTKSTPCMIPVFYKVFTIDIDNGFTVFWPIGWNNIIYFWRWVVSILDSLNVISKVVIKTDSKWNTLKPICIV